MGHDGNPQWWSTQQTSTWERVKEALSRDWEQTKADFSNEYGKDLNQSVTDTVKQAMGTEAIPAPHQRNPLDTSRTEPQLDNHAASNWSVAEPAVRYGYGAASHYGDHVEWDEPVETKLKTEWDDLKSGRTWDEAKTHVRYGWERARRAADSKN